MDIKEFIEKKIKELEETDGFYDKFLQQKGCIWGKYFEKGFFGSNFKIYIKLLNSLITILIMFTTLCGIRLNIELLAITIIASSMIASFFCIIDALYIVYYRKSSYLILSFPIGNLLFWISRGMVLFTFHGHFLSLENFSFWLGLISSLPSFLIFLTYFTYFIKFFKGLKKGLDRGYVNVCNPLEAIIETLVFFGFDQMMKINQYPISKFVLNLIFAFPLLAFSGVVVFLHALGFLVLRGIRGIAVQIVCCC